MPPPGQIPNLTQIGWRLGDALAGIRQTRVIPVAPAPQVQDILHAAHPFMPQSEWASAQRLLNSGRVQDAFQSVARFEAQIRQGYEQYLGESALQSAGMTWEEASRRPWLSVNPATEIRALFEPFRPLAGQKLDLNELEEQATTQNMARDDEAQKVGMTRIMAYEDYANHDADKKGGTQWRERLGQRLDAENFLPYKGYWKNAGYWLFGGSLESDHVQGRFYLSLDKDHALEAWRYLTKTFDASVKTAGTQIQFKMSTYEEGFDRFDTAVVYFQAKDERLLHSLFVKMHREHPEFFKGGRPAFTLPLSDEQGRLLDGLAFGQDPGPYRSFGTVRADLIARVLRIARLMGRNGIAIDWGELVRMFVFFMDKAGLDVSNPAFHKDGGKLFPFLSSLPLAPKPAAYPLPQRAPAPPPQPAPPPAAAVLKLLQDVVIARPASKKQIEPEKLRDDLMEELERRVAALGGRWFRPVLVALAELIVQRWQSDGQDLQDGPRGAGTRLPEPYVDEALKKLVERLQLRKDRKDFQEIVAAIQAQDQGGREKRAAAASILDRLRAQYSFLKNYREYDAVTEALVLTIYQNWVGAGRPDLPIHRPWELTIPARFVEEGVAALIQKLEARPQSVPAQVLLRRIMSCRK